MNPNKFSCVVLIEPSMSGGEKANWFDNTKLSCPVWIFHGSKDTERFAWVIGQNIQNTGVLQKQRKI